MEPQLEALDPRSLRQVLGAFVTGVTVITTLDPSGQPVGLTANSFSSVSLEPPLVLWSQSLSAPSYPIFRDAERFAISILAEDQVEISNRFAGRVKDKFEGVAVRAGLGGVPLVEGAAAYVECLRELSYPGGDHAVFLGRVVRIERRERRPLVFGSGRYLIAAPNDLGAFSLELGVSTLDHVRAVRHAGVVARALADELHYTVGVGVWGNHGPTMVRWEESAKPVSDNLRTGIVLPVLGSATGLALAAHLPKQLTAKLIDEELAAPPHEGAIRSAVAAAQALALCRERGVASIVASDSTALYLHGSQVNAVSVPVFGRDGTVHLALTVVCHASESGVDWEERVTAALKAAGSRLSQAFGAQQSTP